MASRDDDQSRRSDRGEGGLILGVDSAQEWDAALEEWDSNFLPDSADEPEEEVSDSLIMEQQVADSGDPIEDVSGFVDAGGEVGSEETTQALGALLGAAKVSTSSAIPIATDLDDESTPTPDLSEAEIVGTLEEAFDRLLTGEHPSPFAEASEPPSADPSAGAPARSAEVPPAVERGLVATASSQSSPQAVRLTDPIDVMGEPEHPTSAVGAASGLFAGIEEEAEQEEQVDLRLPELAEHEGPPDLSALLSLDQIEPLTVDVSYWERLEKALEIEARNAGSSALAAELEFAAATAAEQLAGQDVAAARYREVLAHRPRDLAALLALWRLGAPAESIGDSSGDAAMQLVGMLRAPARRAVASLLAERVLCARGGELDGAAEIGEQEDGFRRLLVQLLISLSSKDEARFAELAGRMAAVLPPKDPLVGPLYQAQAWARERYGDLEGACRSYAAAAGGDSRSLSCWGGLLRSAFALGQRAWAADALLGMAACDEGSFVHCIDRAARLQDEDGVRLRTSERVSRLRPDDPELVQSHIDQLLRVKDIARAAETACRVPQLLTDRLERAEAHVLAGELLLWARRLDEALAQAAEALSIDPGYAPAVQLRSRVAQWYGEPGDKRDLARELALQFDGQARAAARLEAARASRRAGDRDGEMSDLVAGLKIDPTSEVLLDALERACIEAGAFEQLALALDAAAQAMNSPGRAGELRLRVAELHEGVLQRHSEALGRYQEVARLKDCSAAVETHAAFGARRALLALDRTDDLARALSDEALRESRTMTRRERLSALNLAGMLLSRRDAAGSETCFQQALALDSANELACWQLVLAAAGQAHWDRVSALLQGGAASSSDPLTCACTLFRLGALRESLSEPSPSVREAYEQAALLLPTLEGVTEAVARNVSHTADTQDLEQQLQRQLEMTTDGSERFTLLLLLCGTIQGDIDRTATLRERLQQALALRPESPLVRRPLSSVCRSLGDWKAARHLLLAPDRPLEVTTSILVREQLAEIGRRSSDQDLTVSAYQVALQRDGADLYASRFLQQHYAASQQWQAFVDLRAREAKTTGAGGDAAALWLDLGHLQHVREARGERLADGPTGGSKGRRTPLSHAVRTCYEEALYREPRLAVALHPLLDDAVLVADRERQAALYEQMAGLADRRIAAAICQTRAGELREDDIYSYRSALQAADGYLPAIVRLRDSALRARSWPLAYEAFAALAAHSAVAETVVAAHRAAAAIAQQELLDDSKAILHLRRLIDVLGDWDKAFDHLCALLRRQQRWTDLVELLGASAVREQTSPDRRRELQREIARIARDQLDDAPLAKQQLRSLFESFPDDMAALRDLITICRKDGEWSETADLLGRLVTLEQQPDQLQPLLLDLGRIYQDELDDKQRARTTLRKAAQLDSSSAETLERLWRIYTEIDAPEQALDVLLRLAQVEGDPQRQVDIQLRMAKIFEDKLEDPHRAGHAFRRAMELSPDDLKAIGALCGFYARQGDQRSVMIHLDTALSTMRERLKRDPYEAFAVHAMFKIFGWRRYPDGCLCAAQTLDALGKVGREEREFLETHEARIDSKARSTWSDEGDELIYQSAVGGGFRQIFRLVGEPLGRLHRADLRRHGLSRAERIANDHHPIRLIGDALAREIGVAEYELYIVEHEPTALIVENALPAAVILGAELVRDATEQEIQFLMGRCLWIVRKSMVLPARLQPRDLELLVAAVVRQYLGDFLPGGVSLKELQAVERQVGKAIPRRLRAELMPFALECSGGNFDPQRVGAAVIHSANRAGLLACRSIGAACRALQRAAGDRSENAEAEQLLQFSVSDEYLQLRRLLGIAG